MSSLHYAPLLFYCFKAMFQIVNNIIDMLGTDGKTDGGRLDTACQQAFLIQLGMGGGCRMDHQRLHISHICKQGEQLQTLRKFLCGIDIAFDLKGKDGACSVREIAVIQLFLTTGRQGRMIYLFYLWMIL